MKLVTYLASTGPRLGALVDGQVVDLPQAAQGDLPAAMAEFLALGEEGLGAARRAVESAPASAVVGPVEGVKLLAPVPAPSKVIAVGLNYRDHCDEVGMAYPKSPVLFAKFPSAVIGPGDEIRWDPALTRQVDYEAELAVVIGRRARRVSVEEAMAYVGGYTACNDVSARDLQFADQQWVRGKSLDTFCPLGPVLVTPDEIPDPHNLAIKCELNGVVMQDSRTSELLFGVPELVAFCSRAFTLLPGDVIVTGTPPGVGMARSPQVFLKHGDTVTVEVEGIGRLTNRCVEEQ
ncbi:MAG: FAA hydrolase family protein [Chloroflexi bacterium]|nr:MAG: FAA hydrolase family protein [Chloroflexota bacterium]